MNQRLPRMLAARQKFLPSPPLDLGRTLQDGIGQIQSQIHPGMNVAVAVGSRGITNLQGIVAALVNALQAAGAQPFILPAMGSHGGATPEGQTELLAEYGITSEKLGIPVRAGMDVKRLGVTSEGIEVFCSVEALAADAIVLVNRIKPHTDFSGQLGSGLIKMAVVGLGKRTGAANFHVAAVRHGYERMLRSISAVTLRTAPILCGVAIVENERHQTVRVAVIPREEIAAKEAELFLQAKRLMPKLPFEEIDLLVIDRIGKNISGSGMDPNIINRSVHGYMSLLHQDGPPPRIKRIFVRELTPETHGNAIGIGFADLTTTRLVEAMDRRVTYVNALTALTPQGAKIPIHFDTDKEALSLSLASLATTDIAEARVVRIADTLSLEHMEISEAYLPDLRHRTDLEVLGEPFEISFDSAGNLQPLRTSHSSAS